MIQEAGKFTGRVTKENIVLGLGAFATAAGLRVGIYDYIQGKAPGFEACKRSETQDVISCQLEANDRYNDTHVYQLSGGIAMIVLGGVILVKGLVDLSERKTRNTDTLIRKMLEGQQVSAI